MFESPRGRQVHSITTIVDKRRSISRVDHGRLDVFVGGEVQGVNALELLALEIFGDDLVVSAAEAREVVTIQGALDRFIIDAFGFGTGHQTLLIKRERQVFSPNARPAATVQ